MKFTVEELRTAAILAGLPERHLAWFSDRGEKLELARGDRLFERGQPSDFMFIVVKGAIQRYEEIGGQWLVVATTRQGEVTGMLPFSRMTHYPGYTVATEASQLLRVKSRDFEEMLAVSQEVGRRLVAVMSDRVRGDVRLEQQRERMVALGRLSAGLAHELNNPAAAVRRAVAGLSEQLSKLSPLVLQMMQRRLNETTLEAMEHLRCSVRERDAADLSPLQRSEREEAIIAWLEDHGVAKAWESAGTFVDVGLTIEDLEEFASQVPADVVADAATWIGGSLSADRLLAEIGASAGRISELVAAVKTYSHMDRSPDHKATDVRQGIDNTLTMLSHKVKQKSVRLTRDYQEDLPTIPANAGELNQVWTNLIDNALDAVSDRGEVRIEAKQDDDRVTVRIIDDGPGIPDEIRSRIFEPFYTTKGVGEGTGLGLDIALRIVTTHQGQIEVQSRPGRTEVSVLLPVSSASAAGRRKSVQR